MSSFLNALRGQRPDPNRPLITVAIPVKDPDEKIFTECLDALLAQDLLPYCEILILDSSTRPVRAFETYGDRLRICPLTRQYLSGARQDILDYARGEVIVSIDADCITEPSWLSGIVRPLDRDRGIVATVGHNLSATEGWVSDYFQDAYLGWLYYTSVEINGTRYMFTMDMKNYGVYADVAREIGFDDRLIATEDHDFATRLRRAGYHIVYTPDAKIRHYNRVTLPQLLRQQDWHGFGYGQNVAKNALDIHCQRPFRRLIKQGLRLLFFPLLLPALYREYRKGKWAGVRLYVASLLVDFRFKFGMLRGMTRQGGWAYLKKRFLSDIFSFCPGGEITQV